MCHQEIVPTKNIIQPLNTHCTCVIQIPSHQEQKFQGYLQVITLMYIILSCERGLIRTLISSECLDKL